MEQSDLTKPDSSQPIVVIPIQREKLQKYCDFFELSLPHLLGEEQPQIDYGHEIVSSFLAVKISPEKGIDNCCRNIMQFETDKPTWLKIIRKSRNILASRPETLQANIVALAQTFAAEGLTYEGALKAALRNQRLFLTSAQSIENNCTHIVDRYKSHGLTRDMFVRTGVKDPKFFECNYVTLFPRLEEIRLAEQEGIICYPEQSDGSYGNLGTFCFNRPVTLSARFDTLQRGIDLCRQRYALKGQPYKSIPTNKTTLQEAERWIQKARDSISETKAALRDPSVSRLQTVRKPKVIWRLLVDDLGNAALVHGKKSKRLHAHTATLLRSLKQGVLTPAVLPLWEDLQEWNDEITRRVEKNLKDVAQELAPQINLVIGSYNNGGLRLANPGALMIERRGSPAAKASPA